MTTMGLEWEKHLENKRHNVAMEGFEDRSVGTREKDAETNRLNYGVNVKNSESQARQAGAAESQARSAAIRADNDTMNAKTNAKRANIEQGKLDLDTSRFQQIEKPRLTLDQMGLAIKKQEADAKSEQARAATTQANTQQYLSSFEPRRVAASELQSHASKLQAEASQQSADTSWDVANTREKQRQWDQLYSILNMLPDISSNATANQLLKELYPDLERPGSVGVVIDEIISRLLPNLGNTRTWIGAK